MSYTIKHVHIFLFFFFDCLVLHTQINIKNFITRILICDRPTEKIKKVATFLRVYGHVFCHKTCNFSLCSLVCVWVDYVYTLFSNKKHMISMGLWHGIIFFCCDSHARNTNGERREKLNLNIDYGLMWDDIMWERARNLFFATISEVWKMSSPWEAHLLGKLLLLRWNYWGE